MAGYAHDTWRRFVPRWRGRLIAQQRRDVVAIAARQLAGRLPPAIPWPWRVPVYREAGFNYDTGLLRLRLPRYLIGYWQSENYFADHARTIRDDLRFARPPGEEQARWLARIGSRNAVCLHVRRGDYLLTPALGTCSLAYYRQAMRLIRDRVASPHFFLFSDDWAWAASNLNGADTTLVDANGPDAAVEELRLMAACRHHVISNSTFSWWAAWLGEHADQVVIAPTPWFPNVEATPDLLPRTWLTLPRT